MVNSSQSALGLIAGIARSRTQIAAARLIINGAGVDFKIGSGALRASFGGPRIIDNGVYTVRITYLGDAPILHKVFWSLPGRARSIQTDGYLRPTWPAQGPCGEHWEIHLRPFVIPVYAEPEKSAIGLADELEIAPLPLFFERRRAIADHLAAQEFFLHLDMATSPALASPEAAASIGQLGHQLSSRLAVRRIAGAADQVPVFPPIGADDIFGERRRLEAISLQLRSLVVSHLYDGGDRDLVDWTFEMFAVDLLQVQHQDSTIHGALLSHGSPNSAAFFQFAEFALFAIENGVDSLFWRKHLPTFVRTAHVYAEHGHERYVSGGYPFAEEQYAYAPGRFYSRHRLQELRDEYATDLSARGSDAQRLAYLEDRLTSIVSQALDPPAGTPLNVTRPLPLAHAADLRPGGGSLISL